MIRSEHGSESTRRLALEPELERTCALRALFTGLVPAILALAPVPAGAQLSLLSSAATTTVTARATSVTTTLPAAIVSSTVAAQVTAGMVVAQSATLPAPECDSTTMAAVRGPGTDGVSVACRLTLDRYETITRKIVFSGAAASGSAIQCTCDAIGNCSTLRGGIWIGGSESDGRPQDITVTNCTITGDVRLEIPDPCPHPRNTCRYQPGSTCPPVAGASNASCQSSSDCACGYVCTLDRTSCADTQPGFPEWIRARAPRRITFDHVTIAGSGKDRFYVGWGATETKLINSVISGEATGVPIYLGPHSTGAVIKNDQFYINTTDHDRELISIDGSEHNQVVDNWFSGLNHGGIYLFRNCGEGGHIRHTTPSYNHIVNNVFYYDSYDGSNPAVFLGSRNGNPPGFEIGDWGSYCDDDAGFPFGSSADDRDFATGNVVMQNDIVKRSQLDVIRSTNWVNNSMNLIDRNRTVTQGTWPRPPAGCYVRGGIKEFILNGETTDKFADDDDAPACDRLTCVDGELRAAPQTRTFDVAPSGLATLSAATPTTGSTACNVRQVPIDCQVSDDNGGCHKTVYCPAGTTIVGAVAACNLEYGAVSDADLLPVPTNLIHVARSSDRIQDGSCYVGNNVVVGEIAGTFPALYIPTSAVQTSIRGIVGLSRVPVGCTERDNNGGDCHIRGWLYCR